MKQSELLNISIEELKRKTQEELEKLAFKYTKVLNQKLRRLEKGEVAEFSSAYVSIREHSKTGKARLQIPNVSNSKNPTAKLINHIKDVQEKLRNDKSLSVKETKKIYDKNLKETFGDIKTADVNAIKSFWELFGKMKDIYPNLWYQSNIPSEEILEMMLEYYEQAEEPTTQDAYKYIMGEIQDVNLTQYKEYNDFVQLSNTDDSTFIEEQYDLWNY